MKHTDEERLRHLAGCGSDDGAVIEGFANVLDDIWSYVGDAVVERVGLEEYARDDFEPTDDDKLEGFRRLIDAAIDATE